MNIERPIDITKRLVEATKIKELHNAKLMIVRKNILVSTKVMLCASIVIQLLFGEFTFDNKTGLLLTCGYIVSVITLLLTMLYHGNDNCEFFTGDALMPSGDELAFISVGTSLFISVSLIDFSVNEMAQVPYMLCLGLVSYGITHSVFKKLINIDVSIMKYKEACAELFENTTVENGCHIYGMRWAHIEDSDEVMRAFTALTENNRFPTNKEAIEIKSSIDSIKKQQVVDNESAFAEHSKRATLNQLHTRKV